MRELSILIGGKAGFGIDTSGVLLGRIMAQLSFRVYIYRDYPSLIRGGHTFSIIRASAGALGSHRDTVDFLLALNQDVVTLHASRLKDNAVVIFDPDTINLSSLSSKAIRTVGLPFGKIIAQEGASEITRNTALVGAFSKAAGIPWNVFEAVLRKTITRDTELNLKVARRCYEEAEGVTVLEVPQQQKLPLLTGSEAMGLGLVKAGLKNYIAYPMTPASPLLHFLAQTAETLGLKVIHPENEISVMLMALGFSYAGERAAVGTSGGGFCLMTEGLSLAGMAELPVVILLGQRPGPSTGLPTYSGQTELHFALRAGQGEFARFIIAPGDAEEAYLACAWALNMSWKYQVPSIVLFDKILAEGVFSFDTGTLDAGREEAPLLWDGKAAYQRYLDTADGVSPLAFVPTPGAVIKVNSYEHDASGITTEDPVLTRKMQDKRLRKTGLLLKEIEAHNTVRVYGKKDAATALLCWGSNKWVAIEAGKKFGLRVIHPSVLAPFPERQFRAALDGVTRLSVKLWMASPIRLR